MSIFAMAMGVRSTQYQGGVGDWAAHSDHDRWATGLNQSPQAKQVTTTTVSDPGDGNNITITINGFDVTVSATGLDASGCAAALAAAINADARVRANVIASSNGTTLALTGLTPGLAFTVTESDASLTTPSTTTSAASAEAVPVGRALISQGVNPGRAEQLVALAKSSLLTPQVHTFTTTFVSGAVIRAWVWRIVGNERQLINTAFFASATDLATTLAGLVSALETAMPANTVSFAVNGGSTAIVATAEVPGLEFKVELEHVSGGASAPAFSYTDTTGPNRATSINRALAGISLRPQDEELPAGATEPVWPGNRGLRMAKGGQLFVESAEAITDGAPVYVELGVAADNGKLFTSGSATRLQLARELVAWVRDGNVAADNLAVVRLNIP